MSQDFDKSLAGGAASAVALRISWYGKKINTFLLRRERLIIWSGLSAFVVVFSAIGAWKLWAFGYNGFDLAIYRQVAEHSLRGDWFGFSLHPNKYIGDHFSPIYALLWPLYALWKNPLTLVILQNIALAIVVLPLSKIGAKLVGKPWHLLFIFAYLANPTIQNMALFEFHMLPFAILILTLIILAYLQNNFRRFLLLSLLCLTIREDASLPIIGLGLLALVDRRHWRWSVWPIAAGLGWFWFATKMTTLFGGYDNYKFLYYYSWLGQSFGGIIQTIITRPWLIIAHVVQLSTFSLALVLLIPFAFLPLWRGRWLVPTIPVLTQLLLMVGASTVLIQIHYPAFILPFFFVATIAAWKAIQESNTGLAGMMRRNLVATTALTVAIIIYSSLALGPILPSIPVLAKTKIISDRVRAERALVRHIPSGGVVASMETLVDLSGRPSVYSLHYAFLGHRQFSAQPYAIPDDTRSVILDQRDFLFYQLLYPPDGEDNKTGYQRLRNFLTERGFTVTANFDRFTLLERKPGPSGLDKLYFIGPPATLQSDPSTHGDIDFVDWSTPTGALQVGVKDYFGQHFNTLPISLTFAKNKETDRLYQVEFLFQQHDAEVYRYQTTFGGGIFPTSDWPTGMTVTSNYTLLIPSWLQDNTVVTVRVLDLAGGLGLNGPRSTVPIYITLQPIGPTIDLGQIDL